MKEKYTGEVVKVQVLHDVETPSKSQPGFALDGTAPPQSGSVDVDRRICGWGARTKVMDG